MTTDIEALIRETREYLTMWEENPIYGDTIHGIVRTVDGKPHERQVTVSGLRAMCDALEAVGAERDALRIENGSCWDEGATVLVPDGECTPLPPRCELRAGHLGAHRGSDHRGHLAEWMVSSPYKQVVAERDALRAIIDEVLDALNHDGVGMPWRLRRILSHATTEKEDAS